MRLTVQVAEQPARKAEQGRPVTCIRWDKDTPFRILAHYDLHHRLKKAGYIQLANVGFWPEAASHFIKIDT